MVQGIGNSSPPLEGVSFKAAEIINVLSSTSKYSSKDKLSEKIVDLYKSFYALNTEDRDKLALKMKAVVYCLTHMDNVPTKLKLMTKTLDIGAKVFIKGYDAKFKDGEKIKATYDLQSTWIKEKVRKEESETFNIQQTIQDTRNFHHMFDILRHVLRPEEIKLFHLREVTPEQPLKLAEQLAIFAYTTSLYKIINALSSNDDKAVNAFFEKDCPHPIVDPHEKQKIIDLVKESFIPLLNQGLKKLPPNSTTLFRGGQLPMHVIDEYKDAYHNNKLHSNPRYLSASDSFGGARSFMNRSSSSDTHPVMFTIKSYNGKAIKDYSMTPYENETLFLKGTHYQVIGFEEPNVDTNYYRVMLAEENKR